MSHATIVELKNADEDFEWYPTTDQMIDAVARHIPTSADSIMDIGAGDGRVLGALSRRCPDADLYAIENSLVLLQIQPERVTPVGTDLFDQDLSCLPVDYIFCNPPYSQYEAWVETIVTSGYAKCAYLVIPQRWKGSARIKAAMNRRGASARVIYSGDFLDAERRARAVIDIVEIHFPRDSRSCEGKPQDPFDLWFDQNIDTFDPAEEVADDEHGSEVDRIDESASVADMVAAYNEEYARMEENYRAIFRLDHALLEELGVSKDNVRDGIKAKMAGLKNKYWKLLFEQFDMLTKRLSTATRARFLDRIAGRSSIAFTANNVYAVAGWAIKNANRYYDDQLVKLFRDLSTFEGVSNYASNRKTWEKRDGWRYHAEDHKRYALDYRVVVEKHRAIFTDPDGFGFGRHGYPGDLHNCCHELIDDIRAVLGNLGYETACQDQACLTSRGKQWESGQWEDFHIRKADGGFDRLFQVKAHKNGNLHLRFMPAAIRAMNVEAGRLLGWLHGPEEVVRELGYSEDEAQRLYQSSHRIELSGLKLLPSA